MSKPTKKVSWAERQGLWRERVARHAASGQSIAEFCRHEGIKASSFYMWCRRNPKEAACTTGCGGGSDAAARFIDVGNIRQVLGASDPAAAAPTGRIELRLDLGGGVVLQLVRQ